MMNQYAILLDGGFVLKKLHQQLGKAPAAEDIVDYCNRMRSYSALDHLELLRIYFYHAPPAKDELTNPIDKSTLKLSASNLFQEMTKLLDTLEMQQNFALRLGEAIPMGWKIGNHALKSISKNPRAIQSGDLVPDIKQKGVDLRIGLDIARLSLRQLVGVIVVVTGDSDLTPAFKFARREGIRLYLDHMGHGVRRDLKANTDLVIPDLFAAQEIK